MPEQDNNKTSDGPNPQGNAPKPGPAKPQAPADQRPAPAQNQNAKAAQPNKPAPAAPAQQNKPAAAQANKPAPAAQPNKPAPAPDKPQPAKTAGNANQKPQPENPPMSVHVPKASFKLRHALLVVSFAICVIIPTAITGIYMYFVAKDQFVSTASFSVRKEEGTTAVDLLGGISNFSSGPTKDLDILYDYVRSQQMFTILDEKLDLKELFSRHHADDPFFTVAPDATIEDYVKYWNRILEPSYSSAESIMTLKLRSFDPKDAQVVMQSILEESSRLVNELNAVATEDRISLARKELDISVERLRASRVAMSEFRTENNMVNPDVDIEGQMGVINALEVELASALIEQDLLSGASSAGSNPRIEASQRRIDAIKARIEDERSQLTGRSSDGLTDTIGQYESLMVDTEFATQAYLSAMAAYDSALTEAQRQSRYLAVHIPPTLAESSKEPKRGTLVAVVAIVSFLIWALGALIVYAFRDRR